MMGGTGSSGRRWPGRGAARQGGVIMIMFNFE
jgi:hypothetical protein